MKFKPLSFIILTLMISSVAAGEHCPRCKRPCAPKRECPQVYDPYNCYYPYCSIYQDSRVQDVSNDDGESYWPGKRDDDFIDSLTR